jgi:hypothetical protein
VDQVNPALRTNARSRATLGWNRESVMGSIGAAEHVLHLDLDRVMSRTVSMQLAFIR